MLFSDKIAEMTLKIDQGQTLATAQFNMPHITFNVLRHNNHSYLRDLLTIHNPSRNLRSSSHHLLSVGYMRTVHNMEFFLYCIVLYCIVLYCIVGRSNSVSILYRF